MDGIDHTGKQENIQVLLRNYLHYNDIYHQTGKAAIQQIKKGRD